jgi:hypothetical protein
MKSWIDLGDWAGGERENLLMVRDFLVGAAPCYVRDFDARWFATEAEADVYGAANVVAAQLAGAKPVPSASR